MENDRIVLPSSYAYNSQIIRIASAFMKLDKTDDARLPQSKTELDENQKSSRALSSEKSAITQS